LVALAEERVMQGAAFTDATCPCDSASRPSTSQPVQPQTSPSTSSAIRHRALLKRSAHRDQAV
jgi:hypothetical protein